MKLKEILSILEQLAPVSFQESYDNCGLIVGDKEAEIQQTLVCLDISDAVISEAIEKKCQLIISHHPFIFKPLKTFRSNRLPDRLLIRAIQQDIAIYAMHTCFDNAPEGMNKLLADQLNLTNRHILQPKTGMLKKLQVFCPLAHAELVRSAMFEAGAGKIGNYDSCSFTMEGTGTYRGNKDAQPFAGKPGELHHEAEVRIDVVVPADIYSAVIHAMLSVHPYEEVAYDVYSLDNAYPSVGAGMFGYLAKPVSEQEFLSFLQEIFKIPVIRHSALSGKMIQKVAVCGGSGSFLLSDAVRFGADAFVTGDLKYHDFQIPDNRLLLADVGHFESELFIKDWLRDTLLKKIATFALLVSEQETNPVNYFKN